jgi:hypothetical protein
VSDDLIVITVDSNATIKINPDRSEKQLSGALGEEAKGLHDLIRSKYPQVDSKYIIDNGRLFGNGKWYGTTIRRQGAFRGGVDANVYRIILEKTGGNWRVVTPPELMFFYNEWPNIPREVVNAVNQYRE